MLSKCANPACLKPFLYLREGRIFNIEMEPVGNGGGSEYAGHARRIEHYWLCGNCVHTMTLVCEDGHVHARPAHLALPAGEAQTAAPAG